MARDLRQIGFNRNRYPDKCFLYDSHSVNNNLFIIAKMNSNPKKITATALTSITSTSISVYTIDWAIGEALQPVLTNFDLS